MGKKSDSMTPRQRQSQRIMREKAARKKRKDMWRKAQFACIAVGALTVVGAGFWMWKTQAPSRFAQAISDSVYGTTAKAGFTVRTLYLEGRSRTAMKDIDAALGIKKGDPILRISLDEARQRLEKIESVRMAAVERALPDTLYVRVVEREPVALWQHQGKTVLVDDNGVMMSDIDSKAYRHLPLIVGEDAPKHVAELMTILASEPELAGHFAAAVRVGERRWNIRLSDGVEVKLPERDPLAAWRSLAGLQAKEKLLDRDVKVIDLRIEGRLFIKIEPEDMPGKSANARDT